jgi:mono/diheme cytochrome c family protein
MSDETPYAPQAAPAQPEGELYGLLAEFETPGALVNAARKVRDAGYTDFDCYSPFPVHGIDDAMGIKRTILPLIVFCGGIAGTIGGAFLEWWMNAYNWPWNVSGKPVWSIPANVPIAYETTILASVLTTFFGMWMLNKLPQVWHPFFKLDRFLKVTDDGFMLGIEATDKRFDVSRTKTLLEGAGATAVEECHYEPDPDRRKMPTWIWAFIIATTVMAMIPFAIIAKARVSKSEDPHWSIFPDMNTQPKQKSDSADDIFADDRANRGEIPGTVARGFLKEDDPSYWYGCDGDCDPDRVGDTKPKWITGLPSQIQGDRADLERGQERFQIYCVPCHGYDGEGKGTVPTLLSQAGQIWQPANLTDPRIVALPNGQLFNTISNGRNTMRGYASQIPVEDRWKIVLYVRALERSQHPTLPEDRQ